VFVSDSLGAKSKQRRKSVDKSEIESSSMDSLSSGTSFHTVSDVTEYPFEEEMESPISKKELLKINTKLANAHRSEYELGQHTNLRSQEQPEIVIFPSTTKKDLDEIGNENIANKISKFKSVDIQSEIKESDSLNSENILHLEKNIHQDIKKKTRKLCKSFTSLLDSKRKKLLQSHDKTDYESEYAY